MQRVGDEQLLRGQLRRALRQVGDAELERDRAVGDLAVALDRLELYERLLAIHRWCLPAEDVVDVPGPRPPSAGS